MSLKYIVVSGIALCIFSSPGLKAGELTKKQASRALHRAVDFFRNEVSAKGGYVYRYSADLKRQEGEGKTSKTVAWIQPPSTPTVGGAYLTAYKRTGDGFYLEAARETAYALVRGQLYSGGWDNRIEFDPEKRSRYAYRVDGNKEGRNVTTLDDDKTQSALRFLMHVDQTLDFQDEKIHEAVEYALDHLLEAQYPNGAWPQRFSEPPDPEKFPVRKADYPESWSRTFTNPSYGEFYTFNDNTIADVIRTFLEAFEIYGEKKYREAAEKGGDFILLAQMPEPQPAWAQQYNRQMHPAWARKFEPPAITGGESQGIMRTLLFLYNQTGKEKYLKAVPKALEYLKDSRLPDGRLARFYELKTNRPLYFTKDYKLTDSSDDMPTHYAFIVSSNLDRIEGRYRELAKNGPEKREPSDEKNKFRLTESLAKRARKIVEQLDKRGAWVEEGRLRYHGPDDPTRKIISSRSFAENIETLSRFLAAE